MFDATPRSYGWNVMQPARVHAPFRTSRTAKGPLSQTVARDQTAKLPSGNGLRMLSSGSACKDDYVP